MGSTDSTYFSENSFYQQNSSGKEGEKNRPFFPERSAADDARLLPGTKAMIRATSLAASSKEWTGMMFGCEMSWEKKTGSLRWLVVRVQSPEASKLRMLQSHLDEPAMQPAMRHHVLKSYLQDIVLMPGKLLHRFVPFGRRYLHCWLKPFFSVLEETDFERHTSARRRYIRQTLPPRCGIYFRCSWNTMCTLVRGTIFVISQT